MIKLSKSLRQVLLPHLTAELWVVVKGVQKENTTAIQYKATAMTLMPPKSASDSRDGSRATSSPCATETRSTPKRSKPSSILVCRKSACMKRGGKTVCEMLEQTLRDRGLESQVQIKTTGCMKQCKAGPNLTFMPDKKHYTQVKHKEIPGLIDRHFATLKRSAG